MPTGALKSFGAMPPNHSYNPAESLASPSMNVFVTDFIWEPLVSATETWTGNTTYLVCSILNGMPDPATGDSTLTLFFHLPYDFGGWADTAFQIDSSAGATGWGSGGGGLKVEIYDTSESLDATVTKINWAVANTFETEELSSTGLDGTWLAGDWFMVKVGGYKDGSTTGGGFGFLKLRAGKLRFNYISR